MRGLIKGMAIGLCLVAIVVLGAYVWVGHRASAILAQRIPVPLITVIVPTDSASAAEGERLAWLRGCHGCHDAQLQGKIFLDEPRVARIVAPNIPSVIASYNDAELARLIRHGVRRDSTGVLVMPSASLYHLSDADLTMIIASLRATPRVAHGLPDNELRLLGKLAVVEGEFLPEAASMDHAAPRLGNQSDTTQRARGDYLAHTICAECHGATLLGDASTPALLHAMGYSPSQFTSLMLDGRARDGRDLGLMARTARSRFVHFSPDEIAALYAYLLVMPVAAPAPVRIPAAR
ncbi:MAG: c-type cytochrome [Gemmatimonadota bacterium]